MSKNIHVVLSPNDDIQYVGHDFKELQEFLREHYPDVTPWEAQDPTSYKYCYTEFQVFQVRRMFDKGYRLVGNDGLAWVFAKSKL